jgi:hypothetical protein
MWEGKGKWGGMVWSGGVDALVDAVRKLNYIKYLHYSDKCLIKHAKRDHFIPKKICGICAEISAFID